MAKAMNIMKKIICISILLFSTTLLCNSIWAEDAPEAPSPLLVQSSSNYNLLSVNRALATGVINVINVGTTPITNLTYSATDPKTITVDTSSFKDNCFKLASLPAGGSCQYKLQYTGQGKSATTTSVVFKLSSTQGYDLFRVNAIDMPLNTFFKPSVQATDAHSIADSAITGFTTITKGTITEIYAGTIDRGIFKSTDGGENWAAINSGIPNDQLIVSLASVGSTLYAGTYGKGIFKSIDDGTNWISAGLAGENVTAITPVGSALYVGTGYDGVFKSTDGGETWKSISSGLTSKMIMALLAVGNNIYAAVDGSPYGKHGIFMLKDGDETWTYLGLEQLLVRSFVAVGPTLYAGTCFESRSGSSFIYKSTDGGISWQPTNFTGRYDVSSLISVGNSLYAGLSGNWHEGGIYRSTDGGNSWQPIYDKNISSQNIQSLLPIGSTLYAGTIVSGVLKSTNGDNWKTLSIGLTKFSSQPFLAVENTLYTAESGVGILKSIDKGINWTIINSGLDSLGVTTLTFDGTALYAGTDSGYGIFKSIDHGENWTYMGLGGGAANAIHALISAGNIVYAATDLKICKSNDHALTWSCTQMDQYIDTFLAVDNRIYAGSTFLGHDLFLSSDEGESWKQIYTFTNGINSILSIGNTLYVGTDGGGVFKSTDDGKNWATMNAGLTNLYMRSLASVDATLYAGTAGPAVGGLFKNTAGSESWTAITSGLTNPYISSILSVAPALYVTTYDGIFMEYTH